MAARVRRQRLISAINDADEFDVSAVIDSDSATNEVSESAAVGATVGVSPRLPKI